MVNVSDAGVAVTVTVEFAVSDAGPVNEAGLVMVVPTAVPVATVAVNVTTADPFAGILSVLDVIVGVVNVALPDVTVTLLKVAGTLSVIITPVTALAVVLFAVRVKVTV